MSLAAEIKDLTYQFPETEQASLWNIDLAVPWNTRTLVVGSNGAGKSTLLKLLSGKNLCLTGHIRVNGLDPFSPYSMHKNEADECQITTYLGTEWCHMSFINRDIGVQELLDSIGFKHHRERGETLIDILDVNVNWRMHRLSDGQKRRVQLTMGLLKPWRLLLLDEVTVDLDVLARSRLLAFLAHETQVRRCSIVYATHIFDGLAEWPDKVVHLRHGRIVEQLSCANDIKFDSRAAKNVTLDANDNSVTIGYAKSLHPLALAWLTQDENKQDTQF
ncbi:LANO_0D09956g1_1 [Lachancea nothofagi CBS 11611]|uniref:LANO_0D09956g1_1 n=1 Tax=Lachancea nothofagi CBS 11611 TaxID=1266666 RepID=A0A1G4JJT9_9SACH|nr:LANO_0D09956g1_1 [Lachancea nothofagi CBS 11611]